MLTLFGVFSLQPECPKPTGISAPAATAVVLGALAWSLQSSPVIAIMDTEDPLTTSAIGVRSSSDRAGSLPSMLSADDESDNYTRQKLVGHIAVTYPQSWLQQRVLVTFGVLKDPEFVCGDHCEPKTRCLSSSVMLKLQNLTNDISSRCNFRLNRAIQQQDFCGGSLPCPFDWTSGPGNCMLCFLENHHIFLTVQCIPRVVRHVMIRILMVASIRNHRWTMLRAINEDLLPSTSKRSLTCGFLYTNVFYMDIGTWP